MQEIDGAPLKLQMHSDSQAAIAICNTQSNNWRTRHLRLRAAYVREALESGRYSLHHVSGISMKADIGTKPLPAPRFQQLVAALGMKEPSLTGTEKVRSLDGSLEEKVKILLTCLVVARLLDPVEAHRSENPALGDRDWQLLLSLIVVTVCCWEVAKLLGSKLWKGCRGVISRFCQRNALGSDSTAEVRVARYIDDVVVIGPREAVAQFNRERTEVTTALEGPGAPSTALEAEGP